MSRDTLRIGLSRLVGWLADRRIPTLLRKPVYGGYCRITGAAPDEAELSLDAYPSLGAFFVRRLKRGLRPLDPDAGVLISPCDGTVQSRGRVVGDSLLQAKGRSYAVRELLGAASEDVDLEGGSAWTIYLSPRDYHRVHTPVQGALGRVTWLPGKRLSVAPKVLAERDRVLAENERAVLRMESRQGPYFLVMVGALNVGRIRVLGVEPAGDVPSDRRLSFERGAELARFEMGSTVVLVFPPGGPTPLEELHPGQKLLLGEPIGRFPHHDDQRIRAHARPPDRRDLPG